MLDFGRPPLQIAGATVFADHAEPHGARIRCYFPLATGAG